MSKKNKPKIVHNLEEFLNDRGFSINEPRYWARCFYQYTDCGPWATFLIRRKEAFSRTAIAEIGLKNGRIHIVGEEEGIGPRDSLEARDIQTLGFDNRDTPLERSIARSLKNYEAKARAFFEKERTNYRRWEIRSWKTHDGKARLSILLEEEIPEEIEELYYEKVGPVYKWKESHCGCTLRSLGPHPDDPAEEVYASKRKKPEKNCPACRGTGTVGRNVPTGEVKIPTNENCVGIEFGSIVEGSEANSGPFVHKFPFDMRDFERDVEYMEKETSFYWERDNSHWFHARRIGDSSDQYFLHETWGDIRWDSDKPKNKKLQKEIESYAKENPHDDHNYHPLPNHAGYEIAETCNDMTF